MAPCHNHPMCHGNQLCVRWLHPRSSLASNHHLITLHDQLLYFLVDVYARGSVWVRMMRHRRITHLGQGACRPTRPVSMMVKPYAHIASSLGCVGPFAKTSTAFRHQSHHSPLPGLSSAPFVYPCRTGHQRAIMVNHIAYIAETSIHPGSKSQLSAQNFTSPGIGLS